MYIPIRHSYIYYIIYICVCLCGTAWLLNTANYYCMNTGSCRPKQMALPWWRHQMEKFSALLTLCERNSPVTGEFPSQRPVTWSFDESLICALNKWLCKQSWGWWLWRHCNDQTRFARNNWIYAAIIKGITANGCSIIWYDFFNAI